MLRLLRGIRNLLWVGNIIASLLALGVYMAPHIDPNDYWPFIFLPYLALPLLLVQVVFLGWWLVAKPKYALLPLLTLLMGWSVNTATFQLNLRNKAASDGLRVMSYNMGNFRENGWQPELVEDTKNQILALVQTEAPDLLCIQEYHSKQRGEGDVTDRLFYELGFAQGYFEKIIGKVSWGQSGIAIFSNYPIIHKAFVPFEAKHTLNACIYADILIDGDTVRVFNVHLESNRLQHEELETVRGLREKPDANAGKGVLKIMAKIKVAALERARQADTVRAHIDRSPYPVLLCGDFNDLPGSYAYRTIRGELRDSFVDKGRGTGNTYAGAFPSFRIDQLFADESFDIHSHRVVKKHLSDHYPLLVTLSRP